MNVGREKVSPNQSSICSLASICPPACLLLDDRDVHLWRASLDLPATTTKRLREILSPDEQKRADRFHFPIDRNRFVCGRASLRLILAQYLGIAPSHIRFTYSEYGKPAIANLTGRADDLNFNLAHSAGLALYAVARKTKIGVDVEEIRADFNTTQLATRFFSTNEVASLQSLPATQQTLAFFHCWSRKEAFIKAKGTGLSQSLDQFEVTLDPNRATLLETCWDRSEVARWSLHCIDAGPGFAAALAFEGKNRQLSYFEFCAESFSHIDEAR